MPTDRPKPLNILLVDDHRIVREGLRAVLEREGDIRIAGEADDGQAAVSLCASLRPDVVVMDIVMPGLSGTEATRQVTAQQPRPKVVALSMNHDAHCVREALRAGASAYCVKSTAAEELVRAVRAVSRDETFVSPAVASAMLSGFEIRNAARTQLGQLSAREREVLQLVAEGLSSKEIATRLQLALSTIESHRKMILAKLELKSVAELTKFAIRAGLTTLE